LASEFRAAAGAHPDLAMMDPNVEDGERVECRSLSDSAGRGVEPRAVPDALHLASPRTPVYEPRGHRKGLMRALVGDGVHGLPAADEADRAGGREPNAEEPIGGDVVESGGALETVGAARRGGGRAHGVSSPA
jgi:hypothetical protein